MTTDTDTELAAMLDVLSTDDPDAGRRVRLTPAAAIRMRPVRWTWEQRIPHGALTVIPGREGIGKSLLLAWMTAQVTIGTLPGHFDGQPRPVIYAATEDSWSHTIGPRLYAAGADLNLVYRVDVEQDGTIDQLTLPSDCSLLGKEIRRLGVALLAADPLLSLIHAGIDTHRDRDLRTALEPLVRLADETGCAVVGLAHFNKSASSDALNLITGSRAFSAVARAVLAVARDTEADDGSCVLSQAKNNLGRLDLPSLRYVVTTAEVPTDEGPAFVGRLEFTGESDRSVDEILGSALAGGSSQTAIAAEWLGSFLLARGGRVDSAEVRQAAGERGIAPRTLQRAMGRAGVLAERTDTVPARTIWHLADDDAPSPDRPADARHGKSPKRPVAPQSRQPRQLTSPGASGATGPDPARLTPERHAQQPDQSPTAHHTPSPNRRAKETRS